MTGPLHDIYARVGSRYTVTAIYTGRTSSPVGRPDFNSGEMRNARLVGSTPMSFRHL